MSIDGLASAWEGSALVRARFRKGLPWLQFPIPTVRKSEDVKDKSRGDPHCPTTRAMELNHEILSKMLDFSSMEFLAIHMLEEQVPSQHLRFLCIKM